MEPTRNEHEHELFLLPKHDSATMRKIKVYNLIVEINKITVVQNIISFKYGKPNFIVLI